MITLEDFKNWLSQQESYIFSGCVEEKYPAIKEGFLNIGKKLNHKFNTYKDQTCCTGPLTKMGLGNDNTLRDFTSVNLGLRKKNETILMSSCNGCYNYLKKSNETVTDIDIILKPSLDEELAPQNQKALQNQKPILIHAVEYVSAWIEAISRLIKYPINSLSFALHYGCHYMNQYSLRGEHSFREIYAEFKGRKNWRYNSVPKFLEDILKRLGGNISEYGELILCCGGSTPQRQINLENAISVAEKKFTSLHAVKPDAILTICPLCMYFLEDSQFHARLEKSFDKKIPVIHINELIAVMLGNEELVETINGSHRISLQPIFDKIIVK